MQSKRRVCVVTGTRAEYGLLKPLLLELKSHSEITLQLVATGAHLSPEFGLTYKMIEEDGFSIDEKVEMLISGDSGSAIAKSIGLGVIGFADAYTHLSPDIIVLLGDRYEIFAAAQAALTQLIPIAHIHGGELTEGAIDEAIRHSLTKISHVHFTTTETYRKRVIQLGEQPSRSHFVGSLSLDTIASITLLNREDLSKSLGLSLDKPFFVVTFHPTTLEKLTAHDQISSLLLTLNQFQETHSIIFTGANADADGRVINQKIREYVEKRQANTRFFDNLGQLRYLSCLKHCEMVIGNSSSGLLEVPFFKKPTINIGDRQLGRIKPSSVFDCDPIQSSITHAIKLARSEEGIARTASTPNIFGDGTASRRICDILKELNLSDLLKKKFYDVKFEI